MNPIYEMFTRQQAPSPIVNQNGILDQIQKIRQMLSMTNMSPEEAVKSLISSGRMTQEQFNNYANQANSILGRK